MRILVVDDDEAIRRLLMLELTALGHEVLEADDGLAALEVARREEPDLVLLDFLMPRLNGADTLRRLREDGFPGRVVFVTALSPSLREELSAGEAPDGILRKPFRRRDVLDCLVSVGTAQVGES